MDNRKKGAACLIGANMLYGLSPMFCWWALLLGSNGTTFVAVRSVLAIFTIWLLLKIGRATFAIQSRTLRDACIGAAIDALCVLLLTSSYNYLGGGMATSLHFIYPLCVMAINCALFKYPVSPIKILALLSGTVGIACFTTATENISAIGVLLALASGVVYATYIIFLEHSKIRDLNPLKMALVSNIATAIVAVVYGAAMGELDISGYKWNTYLFCMVPVLANAIAAKSLFQIGVKLTDSTIGSLLSTMEPITSVILGIIFMSEDFSLAKLAGCLGILFSVVLVIYGEQIEVQKEARSS